MSGSPSAKQKDRRPPQQRMKIAACGYEAYGRQNKSEADWEFIR
jgi:hypothetical protein